MKIFTVFIVLIAFAGCRDRDTSAVKGQALHTHSETGPNQKFERYETSLEFEKKQVLELGKKFYTAQKLSMHNGKLLRGTHAKGTCADASLKIDDVRDPKLKVGLFRRPATYSARVRFANGKGVHQADIAKDARAISVAVDLGGGRRQDFSMNNGPTFPITSLRGFNLIVGMRNAGGAARRKAVKEGHTKENVELIAEKAEEAYLEDVPGREKIGLLAIEKYADILTNQLTYSYRNLIYWSGSAFKFGDLHAAKFSLVAQDRSNPQPLPDRNDPDHLQKDLKNWINSGKDIKFDLKVQILDHTKMRAPRRVTDVEFAIPRLTKKLEPWQWVEDVTLDWDEAFRQGGVADGNWRKVGELTVKRNTIYPAAKCDNPQNAFNVTLNSLPEHTGLGRINRARAYVEEESRKHRRGR